MADSQSADEIVLMQAYISRARIESFSLIADLNYISQNAPRICRALFEICLRKGWYVVADQLLTFSKVSQLQKATRATLKMYTQQEIQLHRS